MGAILVVVFLGIEKCKLRNIELIPGDSEVLQYASEELNTKEDDINVIYGSYKIVKFFPTQYYQNMKFDVMPQQEADMLLNRIVVIDTEILITYDTERSLGTRRNGQAFDGNYIIETYTVRNPEYGWSNLETDTLDVYIEPDDEMEQAIGKSYFKQLDGVISTPQLCEPYGKQYFYTLADEDKLIMFSQLTNQYFLLEKCADKLVEGLPEWTECDREELLKEIFGEYQVIEFLPTKYYPALDSNGCEILPREEADMMVGQEIVLKEELFISYDNYRRPNSFITGRMEDDFWIEKVEVQNPQYHVKSVRYEEIYGIREGMLAEQLEQQEYVEIDVHPGYETNGSRILPQLFLMDDGKIILYSMGEYFLLDKGNEKDEFDNITEMESFEEIINGDMSSLYQIKEEDRNFIKQLAQNGDNEWSLCDINGDGKQELILQERQGELEGNIRHIIAIFAETEEGVKRVLWDIFETGEFYSFIDGRLIHYCYVNGTYNADFYYRCIFDDDWEMREDRLFEILDVTSLDEYDFLSDEMKKEIPSVGFYYRYVTYGENDRETAALLSEDEWRDMFKEEMGEYGRVSTFMHRFAPFDIYVGEVTKEDTDNQSDENNQVTQEPETESPESKIAAMCDTVRAMDFTANEPHMDITPEENQKYLEAYLKVLKNEISIYRQSGEEIYYRDLWKAGDKFEDLLEDKWHDRFYYDDLDGDGKPELAIKQGCLYIFNYELEDETCSIIYDQETCYFGKIIGAGQIWYHDGLHADIIRDRLITFDEENEEVALNLEEGINKKHPYYMVGIGEKEWVDVGKENWDEITAPFFEMIENHGLQEMTLEEVFGEIL